MKYTQVHDGDWIRPNSMRGHKLKCCDCGLVHRINFRVVGGVVEFQAFRDNRGTAQVRRKAKPTSSPSAPR
jgi:hypothetical protein